MYAAGQDEKNFFSRENLSEIAQIESHLEFIDEFVVRHSFGESESREIHRSLEKIKEKQGDKLLNMSVIGEFSAGKSTFINAMLRSELLAACSLQGTTVANTVIEHSDGFSLVLEYKDGKKEELTFDSLSELSCKVESATSDPEVAKEMHTVRILLPAKNLENDFRIIDTPGTNALEVWHEEVTKRAIYEISDISVILVDSAKPFPESFCNFVNSHLESILPQCVFVMTKFDMIPEKERKMVIAYAKAKVQNVFGISDPVVLPYSSVGVLYGEGDDGVKELSADSEEKLIAHMAKQRTVAQAKKLVSLTDSLYDLLNSDMETMGKDCDEKLALLEQTKRKDLSGFIAEQKEERKHDFMRSAEMQKTIIVNGLYNRCHMAVGQINSTVNMFENNQALGSFLENSLLSECQNEVGKLEQYAATHNTLIEECYKEEMLDFKTKLLRQFNDLELLDFVPKELESGIFSVGDSVAGKYASAVILAKNELVKDCKGSFQNVFGNPFFGKFMGGTAPKLSVKQKAVGLLRTPLEAYFSAAVRDLDVCVGNYIDHIGGNIDGEIDSYLEHYRKQIDDEIEKEKLKKAELETKKVNILAGIKEIENRRFVLASVNRQIDIMIGGEA